MAANTLWHAKQKAEVKPTRLRLKPANVTALVLSVLCKNQTETGKKCHPFSGVALNT
jgi:hypothetical protein